jgi:hypothetical protein
MAGLGFKTFTAGEVLTAANLQGYAIDQSVMVFDNETARTTALGTLVSEGMVSYLKDTNALQVYGTAWADVSNPGDITAVAAGYGLAGGGTAGDVTLTAGTTVTDIGTATYTLQTADAGTYLRFTDAATVTVSTATDFGVGQQVQIFADGTALAITTDGATIAGAGTSITSGTFNIGAQYEALSVFCVATDNYRIIGNVSVA